MRQRVWYLYVASDYIGVAGSSYPAKNRLGGSIGRTDGHMDGSEGLRGSGTDGRRWITERVGVDPGTAAFDETPVSIPVRDGVRLSAVQMLPRDGGPHPTVVVTNGYSALDDALMPQLRHLAADGYAVVVARLRGVAPSEGKAGLYEKYGPDGYDVIEWAAAQPFSNGKVGMVGASLLGISQWFAARERPPHLVAVVPDDAPNDAYRYLWYAGGMPPGPGRRGRSAVPGVESEYDVAIAHPAFDAFWRERSVTADDIRQIARDGVPALLTSGWDSYILDGASRAYGWMCDGGAADRVRLVIGPWGHAMLLSDTSMLGEAGPGELIAPYRGVDLQRLWLAHWLKGESTPLDGLPPVQIFVQGPDRWRFEDGWPLPDERRDALCLVNGAGSAGELATTRRAGDPVGYAYDPETAAYPAAVSMPAIVYSADGPPRAADEHFPSGATRPYGRLVLDRSSYERTALTWTSAPLAGNAEITGFPTLHVWASASRPDAAFVVELTDVAPDAEGGASLPITRGYRQAVPVGDPEAERAWDPAAVSEYEIELSPTSYVVPAGHRIRIVLQGTPIDPALPLQWQGPPPPEHHYTLAVHSDEQRPSRLVLPVIGAPLDWAHG